MPLRMTAAMDLSLVAQCVAPVDLRDVSQDRISINGRSQIVAEYMSWLPCLQGDGIMPASPAYLPISKLNPVGWLHSCCLYARHIEI